MSDYLGECLAVDAGLGVLIERLEAIGEIDNTFIVVSGDHGIPGFPRGKVNLYDIGCEVALAARWPGRIHPGRVVEDFVNLMDLAPTFLDAADVDIPDNMSASSFLPVLESDESGQVDGDRTWVVTGRERHAEDAREGGLPYPTRAIRTRDFLYIHNFAPDRWPVGDPMGLDDLNAEAPSWESILKGRPRNGFPTPPPYREMDGGPTKAWMIHHRADEDVQPLFQLTFVKRPREELFDLRVDPDHMNNVADHPDYQRIRKDLADNLMRVLRENDDPRLVEDPIRFDHSPYAGPLMD